LYGTVLSEWQIDGYLAALKPWGQQEIIKALGEAVKECSFFPKPSEIIVRIPSKRADTFLPEPKVEDAGRELGKDLYPLFMDYLNKKTTLEEWVEQMQYFADKHGLGERMRDSIRQCGLI